MGKSEDAVAEKPVEENTTTEESSNPSEEKVEDVDNLRTVIKLDEKEGDTEVEGKSEEAKEEENPKEELDLDGVGDLVEEAEDTGGTASASTREALEQKRALLQRIKDFDLQIKKNQQDITDVSEKMNAVSKDLDDLVSLYEIVSEQMNPFVGLSKVTKKRLESFETINKEIGIIKEKLSMIEAGGPIDLSQVDETNHQMEIEESIEQGQDILSDMEEPAEIEEVTPDIESIDDESPTMVMADSIETAGEVKLEIGIDSIYDYNLTDDEIDEIIDISFSKIPSENNVDRVINEYIESLKAG